MQLEAPFGGTETEKDPRLHVVYLELADLEAGRFDAQ